VREIMDACSRLEVQLDPDLQLAGELVAILDKLQERSECLHSKFQGNLLIEKIAEKVVGRLEEVVAKIK